MSLGGGSKTTTTVQDNSPWSAAQPYLKRNVAAVSDLPAMQAFDQSLAVPFSEQSLAGLQGLEGAANTAAPQLSGVFGSAASEAQGDFSNPAFQSVLNRAKEDALTNTNALFSGAGWSGTPGHAEALGRGISDATGSLMVNQMNAARGQIPGLYNASVAPAETLLRAGGLRESETAAQLQDEARRFYEAQDVPFQDLAQRNALFTGAGSLGGTSRGSVTAPGTNWGQVALGTGLQTVGGGK